MTTTISLPHQLSFYQWDNPNQVGLETGTLGGANVTTSQYALFMIGANDTLINTGAILNGYGDHAIGVRNASSTIINQLGGTIESFGGTYGDGIYSSNTVFVTNSGLISGSQSPGKSGAAIFIKGGFVSNTSTGTLISAGVYMNAYGTVINSGKIFGDSVYGGVELTAGGMVTNLSGGYIAANGAGYGVQIKGGGTVSNAGEINGGTGYAVKLATGVTNKVVVDSTGVFIGTVSGGTAADATLELASSASKGTLTGFGSQFTNFGTLDFAASSTWLVQANTSISSITIDGFVQGDTIDITGFTAVNVGAVGGGTSVTLTNSGGTHEVLHFNVSPGNMTIASGPGITGTDLTTICFCVGTLIDTPDGEVQVEKLRPGDTVSTAHNGPRKVTWVGNGKVLATRGRRSAATPVIVLKGALADNVPHEDLRVTKAHSLYIDGVLIPVEFLVNHKTILWDDRAQEVEIYHVELESHDVLIANGVPAESYRDDGNRWLFRNANEGWDLPPQEPCAPVLTGGPVVDAVWQRLLDRAGPRDLPPLTDDPDLHLIIDGARVDAQEQRESVYVFRVPSGPKSIIIASRAGVPSELGIARDPRSLGVALRQIAIRRGTKFMLFKADDQRLATGFHDYEPSDGLRWTDGYAELPIEAFARFDKGAEVMLHLGGVAQYPDSRERSKQAAA
jgi:hypothetical protein